MPNAQCENCGYALVRGMCPMCAGRVVGERLVAPELPILLRGLRVTREQFITAQHYHAWLDGRPLRRHLEHRKKIGREDRDAFARGHSYRCSICPATSLLTLDHIVPQILGGSSLFCNLRYLCGPDNREAWQQFAAYLKRYDRFIAEAAA